LKTIILLEIFGLKLKFNILFVFSVVILVLITGFSACNEAEEFRQGNTIFYYPKPNLYYDVEEKQYFFFSDDNKEWQTEKNPETFQKDSLGKNVVIENPSQPVWKDNEHHRIVYGASLYTSAVDLQRKYYEDSINSLPKTAPVIVKKDTSIITGEIPEEKVEDEKKGLKKFLDRVFKKKKD
jgi:hypothetical protein